MKFILDLILSRPNWPRRFTSYKTSDGMIWFKREAAIKHQDKIDSAAASCADEPHCYDWPGSGDGPR